MWLTFVNTTLRIENTKKTMKKEIKFSLLYRDLFQSSGKYQPRADQLARIAPVIVDMGCFARVETNVELLSR